MTTKPNLTLRQQEIYDLLKESIQNRGYGPSIREIGHAVGIGSPNGVMCHLKALEKKGLITREAHLSRSIQLSGSLSSPLALPSAGRLSSTNPLDQLEQIEPVDFAHLFDFEKNFAVTASGDALAHHHIVDGDTIVLQATDKATNGDIVLVEVVGQEAVLAVYWKDGNQVKLESKGKTKAASTSTVTILGTAVGVIRSL